MKHAFTLFLSLLCVLLLYTHRTSAQGKLDSLFQGKDTTAVLDSLMADFDDFLDSLLAPRSFVSISASAGTGFFSFEKSNSNQLSTETKLLLSPSIGYYHKSGLGISAMAFMLNDDGRLNLYQYAISPSYDYINPSLATGIAYTYYHHQDSLNFYTTPISSELFAYFSYRKWWLRPTISFAYGWGSKAEYEERKRLLQLRRWQTLRDRFTWTVRNEESIQDFAITFSLRHDFRWYDVVGKNDNLSFTPMVLVSGGTQRYGFNTSYSYSFSSIRTNSFPSNNDITDQSDFAVQTAGAVLRLGYMKGVFFLQPQVLFDYYVPASDDPLHVVFSVTAGVNL